MKGFLISSRFDIFFVKLFIILKICFPPITKNGAKNIRAMWYTRVTFNALAKNGSIMLKIKIEKAARENFKYVLSTLFFFDVITVKPTPIVIKICAINSMYFEKVCNKEGLCVKIRSESL